MTPTLRLRALSVLLLIAFFVSALSAQSESGSSAIEGTVTDAKGMAVASATVTAVNLETGLQRMTSSDARGDYHLLVLPVGRYSVRATADGFTPAERNEVILIVGETTPVHLKLNVAGRSDEVTVTGTREAIDVEDPATGTTVSQRAVEVLPIRGRNFTDFIQLTPSVVQESDRKGLVIAGQRSINSNIAIDGSDFNDALQGNQRGGNDAIFFFPQTAIREFQVVRSGASAEVGRTAAGFVNAVTKSGTNELHGEAFYMNRNRHLTSADAFDNKGRNLQNQFGASAGGPLRRDRAFLFVGAEQNFLRVPYFVQFSPPSAGLTVPSNLVTLQGEHDSTNNPTAVFTRADFILSSKHTLNVQYSFARLQGNLFGALVDGTTLTSDFASTNYTASNSSHGVKLALVSVLGGGVINEFRTQPFASDHRLEQLNTTGPEVRVDNFGRFGNSGSRPRRWETERYQFSDNLSMNAGRHQIRLGFDWNINDFAAQRQPDYQGTWRFSSLADYINAIPRRLTQTIVLSPDLIVARGRQQELAFFVQDNVKIAPSLSFTAGLRWEGQWNPTPVKPNPALPETARIPNDLGMWQPRAGLTWDVGGHNSTVVRISSGLYDPRTPSVLFLRVFTNNDVVTKDYSFDERSGACRTATGAAIPADCVFRGPGALVTFPNILTGVPTFPPGITNRVLSRVFGFRPDFRNPRSFQVAASVEQRLDQQTTVSVGYIRNSTWNLQRRVDRNLGPVTIDPATNYPLFRAARPNPTIGIYSMSESSAHSSYDGLALSIQRRYGQRFLFGANYTLSDNRDDDSNERNFSRETVLNPFDLTAEEGPSKQDVRHNFNLNGLVDVGAGFTVSGILFARSGFPYTAVIGDDVQGDGNTDNDRAVIGGKVVGRNTFRQPTFFNLDLRVLKTISIDDSRKIVLAAEFFNVTRASNKNFGVDSISIYGNAGNGLTTVPPPTTFPLPGEPFTAPSTARFGGPRQMQISLRFQF